MMFKKQKRFILSTNTVERTVSPENTVKGSTINSVLHTVGHKLGGHLARFSFGNETPKRMNNESPLGLFLIVLMK